jgi:hypothetical protein
VAKDTQASQDALIDILKHIEMCFRPLEFYWKFLTTEMSDKIIQIVAEVLAIFGIAMVDVKQGNISKYICANMLLSTECDWCSGKHLNMLIRKSEIENSLKRLDVLIQEVLVATAINVTEKVIRAVDDKVTLVDTVATSDKIISGA